MEIAYLAIENDKKVHERESKFWLSRGVSSIRVSSMSEGIKHAMDNQFLYIVINAANINYIPQLRLLREATNDPILIATTSYTMQEQGKAVSLGADLFGQISDNPNENYESVMAVVNRVNMRARQQKISNQILVHGDILVVAEYHKAFVKDVEIHLTSAEMKILHYLMVHHSLVLTYRQIYHTLYNDEYDELSPDIIYSTMKRLRKKMRAAVPFDYIETVRDVGYRLLTKREAKK